MAQDFSCTQLEFTRLAMESMWADANFRREIQPEVEVVKALKEMQTANLTFFDAGDKKKKAKVYWVEACEGAVQDCTTDCDFAGTPVSSNCQDYEITGCKETLFSLDDSVFHDNHENFQNAVTRGFMKHTTFLDNFLETQGISALDAMAGVNKYDGDSRANVVGSDTFIDGPFWTPSIMSYFEKVKRLNYMPEASMLSGENMYDMWWNAEKDASNANGSGAKNKFDTFNWKFDLKNFDTVLAAKRTLMVSPHAAAFVTTNRVLRNEDNPSDGIRARFTIDSLNIPGVKYDVYYRTECKNGGEDVIHHWRIVARYDFFQSPVMCDNDCTGVLSFDCGVAAP